MSSTTDVIGVTEAAEILGRSVRTVNRKAQRGEIAHVGKLPGKTGAYLFHRADITALAAQRPRQSVS